MLINIYNLVDCQPDYVCNFHKYEMSKSELLNEEHSNGQMWTERERNRCRARENYTFNRQPGHRLDTVCHRTNQTAKTNMYKRKSAQLKWNRNGMNNKIEIN